MIPSSLHRKVSAVLVAAMLLLTALPLPISALTPYSGYSMSSAYKSSIYYENLLSLTLTGNGASDVLMVAMSQLGYHEGNSDSDFGGTNTAGSKNFVEYNRLYGKLDNNEGNGTSYGYAWCASFVNWCLRQAGISRSIAGGEVSCSRWIRDFLVPSGLWEDSPSAGGRYTPKAGDLIFFRKAGSSALSTHVGLVLYTDGTYVYTVEGNTASGDVALDSYNLQDSYIIGYGTPQYKTNGDAVCDYARSGKTSGIYIVSASELNVRTAPTTASRIIGTLKRGLMVEVLSFETGFAKIKTAEGTAYTSLYYLKLVTVPKPPVYTVTFLDGDGSTVLSVLSCEEGLLPTAPNVGNRESGGVVYTFVGWSQEIVPAVSDMTYVALFEEKTISSGDGTGDTDGTGGETGSDSDPEIGGEADGEPLPDTNGQTPPDTDGATRDEESDTNADSTSAGCNATVGTAALGTTIVAALFGTVVLRKKKNGVA